MTLPVVNYERIEKFSSTENNFKIDMNKICIIFFIIIAVLIFKRYKDVSKEKKRFHI